MSEKSVTINVNLVARDGLSPVLAEAARNAQGLGQQVSAAVQGLSAPRLPMNAATTTTPAAASQGLTTTPALTTQGLGTPSVPPTSAGLAPPATVPTGLGAVNATEDKLNEALAKRRQLLADNEQLLQSGGLAKHSEEVAALEVQERKLAEAMEKTKADATARGQGLVPPSAITKEKRAGLGGVMDRVFGGAGEAKKTGSVGTGAQSGFKRFARPVLRHAMGAVSANVGGLGALIGPVMALGPAAGGAAAAVWGVTAAIGKYNNWLDQQRMTLEEFNTERTRFRSATTAASTGLARQVTREEFRDAFHGQRGTEIERELRNAQGNQPAIDRILSREAARANQGLREEAATLGARRRTMDATGDTGFFWTGGSLAGDVGAAGVRQQRDEGAALWVRRFDERREHPEGLSLEHHRETLLHELQDTNLPSETNAPQTRRRLARQRGASGAYIVAHAAEFDAPRMPDSVAERMAHDIVFSETQRLSGQLGTIEAIRTRGLVDLHTGAVAHVGGLNVGSGGDIGSLHQAIEQASIVGETQDWQNSLLQATKDITTRLSEPLNIHPRP